MSKFEENMKEVNKEHKKYLDSLNKPYHAINYKSDFHNMSCNFILFNLYVPKVI